MSASPRFARNLSCSVCAWSAPIDRLYNLCPLCSAPLLVRYDLSSTPIPPPDAWHSLWRWSDVLPLSDPGSPVTLGEGATPSLPLTRVLPAAKGLFAKDESLNPTRSFKSRGMAVAVTMARALGATSLAAPTAGNAGCALAAYGARAGMPTFVAMPSDTPASIIDECRSYGATVELVEGVITVAAARVRKHVEETGAFDLATLKEPYRIEGKKTMGYELLTDLGRLPEVILYPTGGGTGLIGMWKAFDEMQALGWIGSERPRMYSVQAEGCAPIVRAFDQGLATAPEWESPVTAAWGLRVPRALGDRLILTALRASGGGAIAVPESAIEPAAERLRREEGLDAGPEGGACLVALEMLIAAGTVKEDETVVLFNTGGNKYR